MSRIRSKWFIACFLMFTFLFFAKTGELLAQRGDPPDKSGFYVAGELLIQPKAGVSKAKAVEIIKAHGATIIGEISQIRVIVIEVPEEALEKVKEALERNPNFNFVEYNFLAEPTEVPNDSYYTSQWHLPKISAPLGWDISTGAENVAIAILDTGVDPTHPDLSSKLLPGYNFYDKNTDSSDVYGHGTAVAGSAAALSDNYIGVAGVAWKNPILPLRISAPNGWATYSAMASAMIYAADRGAKVINLSYAGESSSSTLQNAVNYAWNKGAVVVASAGNYSIDTPYYPAACNNAVSVSATGSNDSLASFSNYGNWIDVSAPGVSIYTTANGGGYRYGSGTSFSSPITAGLVALIFSANSNLSNAEVVEILLGNADDLGASGFDPYYGWGRINVYKSLLHAVNATPQPDVTPPNASITSPADGSTLSGQATVSVSATDNVGVSKVELYINGSLYLTDTTEPYNFLLDTTKFLDGAYNLIARAYDPSGNIGQSNGITVNVSNPKVITCVRANPTVALSSSATQWVTAGTTMAYTVAVTNNDSSDCSASTFDLSAAVPSSWTASFGSPALAINPGAKVSTTLSVNIPSNTADGFYTVTVTATNSADPTYKSSASVKWAILSSLTVGVSTDKSSYNSNQPVPIKATVSANGSAVANATVTFTITKGGIAVGTNTVTTDTYGNASFTWTQKPKATGTYLVTAKATFNGFSGSGTATFSVK